MDTSQPIAWAASLLFIATLYSAEKRDWKQGSLISVELIDIALRLAEASTAINA